MRELKVEIQMESIQTEACEWLKLQTEGSMYAKDNPETAALIKKAEAAREFYLGADFAIARGTHQMFAALDAYNNALRELVIHYAKAAPD